MTTKQLLAKAHKIASKYFDVEEIDLVHKQGFEKHKGWELLGLTCTYELRGCQCSFSCHINTDSKDYGVEGLIRQFKIAVRHERNKLFPQLPQTTDLEISETTPKSGIRINGNSIPESKIIIGPDRIGKTRLARKLYESYPESKSIWLNGRLLIKFRSKKTPCPIFFFNECTKDTELVIIDDIPTMAQLESLITVCYSEIRVNKKYHEPFNISPAIILTCDAAITKAQLEAFGASLTRRFEIIDLTPATADQPGVDREQHTQQ